MTVISSRSGRCTRRPAASCRSYLRHVMPCQVLAIGELIREGKIRHWALSNETTYGVMSHVAAAETAGVPRPIALQQSYSLIHREAESGLAELCSPRTLGLGILPWSALAGGVLTGKPSRPLFACRIRCCMGLPAHGCFFAPFIFSCPHTGIQGSISEGSCHPIRA